MQIISGDYGTGGKNADVTERVKQLIEVERKFFAANPGRKFSRRGAEAQSFFSLVG